jgi:FKBP-type peptidyl-prolyl cis-trans isomerase
MFNKFEVIGAGISIMCMVAALYLVRVETNLAMNEKYSGQQASVLEANQASVVTVGGGADKRSERADAYLEATNDNGKVERMVIEDIKVGEGAEVKIGDTVAVHYIGTLQNGTEFDNSKKRGTPFEFKVGGGQVIKGWDEGLIGMKVGGNRVLVIPPEMAYGEKGIGPIPGNATLVFAIELIEIK